MTTPPDLSATAFIACSSSGVTTRATSLLLGHCWLFGARAIPMSTICLAEGYLALMLSTTFVTAVSQAASPLIVLLYTVKNTRSGVVAFIEQTRVVIAGPQKPSPGFAQFSVEAVCAHLISH